MIYVDGMGHCFSDTSLEELYDFGVNKLKLKPEWNHYSRHFPHFDLTTAKKKNLALALGATLLSSAREALPVIKKAEEVYKAIYPIPHVDGKGLYGQAILRVDFKKYFAQNEVTPSITKS